MTVGGGDDAARAVSVAERDEGEGAREWGVVTVDDAETTGTMGTRGDEGGHLRRRLLRFQIECCASYASPLVEVLADHLISIAMIGNQHRLR